MAGAGRLAGETILITGGGAGIGRATAIRAADEGANIGIMTRTGSQADEVVRECRVRGVEAAAAIGDVGDAAFVTSGHASLVAELGDATTLINNVAIGLHAPFLEATDDHYFRVFEVNFFAAVRLTRLVLPAMLAAKRGSIINVSSVQGLLGWDGFSAYSASKGALMSWSRQLANEFGESGIRFNSVLPGAVMTPMQAKRIRTEGPDFLTRTTNLHIIPRMQQPEEVASAILFLASEESSFITGSTLDASGGTTAKAHWYA